MLELVDTHCHIQSAGNPAGEQMTRQIWGKDPALTGAQLITSATNNGITRLICVGCDLKDSQVAIDFVQGHQQAWASIGIHPHEAAETLAHGRTLPEFAALVHQPKVVAIGECGLDYFYNHSPKEAQLTVLEFQLQLAIEANLPLILHVREAFDDFWPVFDRYQGIRGVLHSFTDSRENLEKAIERGLHIGVNGIATFTKNLSQLDVYRAVPLQKLLLETDAPFLTPTPYRGTINEPKRVGTIAEFLANIRGESLEQLANATTHNACNLFHI